MSMMRKVWARVLLGCAAAVMFAAEAPPKELVSYIREARGLGQNDAQIRRNAAIAGWDARLIDDAFAVLGGGATPAPGSGPAAAAPEVFDGYRIGPGDSLQISVYQEAEASVPDVIVRADGKISLPLIKEVEVAGLTPNEAEKLITDKLSRFIRTADVTVIVRAINSQKAYLVGGVRSVGAIDLRGRTTVLQALTQAGGLSDYAKRSKIYILREEGGKQLRIPFNYNAVIRGEKMEQNIVLRPNDTVVVPQ